MAFPISFAFPWYAPFLTMVPIAWLMGFVREGIQDSERPGVKYFWQPFPWSTHKWIEASAWGAGALAGAIGGIWV